MAGLVLWLLLMSIGIIVTSAFLAITIVIASVIAGTGSVIGALLGRQERGMRQHGGNGSL